MKLMSFSSKFSFRIGIVAVLLLSICNSCNDIIEKEITDSAPVIILPQMGDTIPEFGTFSWQQMDGAKSYHLEIYSPSFASPTFIAADTITSNHSIDLILQPGNYEYQLTALNNGYESQTAGPISFVVDTIGGSQLSIDLISPNNSTYYGSNFNGLFQWESISNVTSYELSLRKGQNYASGVLIHNQNNITSTSWTSSGIVYENGYYTWSVTAVLSNGTTTSASIGSFMVDDTPPPTPSLSSPANGGNVFSPVVFTWNVPADVGTIQSPITSVIEISTDASFSTILETSTTNDSTISLPIAQSGTYYWRVYLFDQAGNFGNYSAIREFIVN